MIAVCMVSKKFFWLNSKFSYYCILLRACIVYCVINSWFFVEQIVWYWIIMMSFLCTTKLVSRRKRNQTFHLSLNSIYFWGYQLSDELYLVLCLFPNYFINNCTERIFRTETGYCIRIQTNYLIQIYLRISNIGFILHSQSTPTANNIIFLSFCRSLKHTIRLRSMVGC